MGLQHGGKRADWTALNNARSIASDRTRGAGNLGSVRSDIRRGP